MPEIARPDRAVLYWTAEGAGPDVVLSHGVFAEHHTFDPLARALVAAGYRVVRWDLRAHGRSSRGQGELEFDELVGDLLAVVEAAAATDAVLVGHDLGGVLSIAACLARPDAFAGLSVWCADAMPAPIDRVALAAVSAARHVAIRPLTLAMEPLMSRAADRDSALALLQRRTATALAPAAVAEVVRAAAARDDLRARLRELWVPVQVVWGEQDRLVRPFAARDLLAGLPAADAVPVPEAAHLVYVDRPDVVTPALLGFLARVARP